jgi:hypothetical protein
MFAASKPSLFVLAMLAVVEKEDPKKQRLIHRAFGAGLAT